MNVDGEWLKGDGVGVHPRLDVRNVKTSARGARVRRQIRVQRPERADGGLRQLITDLKQNWD